MNTMTDWRTLEAGPELDAIVAERLFSVDVIPCQIPAAQAHAHTSVGHALPSCCLAHYSTTWEGMGLVVERMADLGFDFEVTHYKDRSANVEVWKDQGGSWTWVARDLGDTVPLATCRAALAALEWR